METELIDASLIKSIKFDPPGNPVNWISLDQFRDLQIGTIKISPVYKDGQQHSLIKKIRVTIHFPKGKSVPVKIGKAENSLYRNRVINWEIAKNWVSKPVRWERKTVPTLPDGDWYRIAITSDGIYRLTYEDLTSAGINMNTLDPKTVTLYTNPSGGRPMPSTVGIDIPENLVEVAMEITGDEDDTFNEEDEIIFYGRGPRGFDPLGSSDVSFTQNPYTDINYYWLLIPTDPNTVGERINENDSVITSPLPMDYGLDFVHHEVDLENPYQMGLFWVGAGITRNQSISIAFNLHHPKSNIEAKINMTLFGGTTSSSDSQPRHKIKIYQRSVNDTLLVSQSWSGLSVKDFTKNLKTSLLVNGPNFIVFQNNSNDESSKIFLDRNTVKYGRKLVWEGSPFEFWAPPNVSVARFEISNGDIDLKVWDISDFLHPIEILTKYSQSEGLTHFETSLSDSELKRFIIFTPESISDSPSIEYKSGQKFNSLRKEIYPIDHIIVSPEEFLTPAGKLQNHRTNSIVAPLQAIYDEFSGGVVDPLAIRYFLKWTKENWRTPSNGSFPSFVLLLGDGDYDYRNITGNSQMRVPPFQSDTRNRSSSDDRFTFFEGETPEMAIGRFTAVTLSHAENMVDKTIAYEKNPEMGLWRRKVTLIADDFKRPYDSSIELSHTTNSEEVYDMIPRSIDVGKIYMEDFPIVNDGSQYGVKKPDATEALFNVLEEGTVLLNYIGHGSPYQWAQEGLLSSTRGDLANINTGMKIPIWIAATCSWGHYDLVEGSAMSEELLRLPFNGAIAVISTNDVITFSANKSFILKLFSSFFPNGQVTTDPIGAVFQSIKTSDSASRLFHLFGDPGLKLALPTNTVAVNEVLPDTLKALTTGSYSGNAINAGELNGDGYIILYDADKIITQTGYSQEVTHILTGNTLFRGFVNLSGGNYKGEFIIPKDINFSTSNGRIAVYLYGDSGNGFWEGLGVKEGLILAGGTTNTQDDKGPVITFMLEDRMLQWGDHIPENSELTLRLSDPLGINVTSEVGHAIRLWIDEDETNATDLTHLFVYDAQNYTTGTISLSMDNLSPGETILTVEGWDNANNPSRTTIALNLTTSDDLQLKNVFNYPNPFRKKTQFGFEVTQEAYVTIKIFTIAGQLVSELRPMESYLGYSHINWDGRDDFGDLIANGVYLYQIKAESVETGKKVTKIQKLAKYR
ncbi:MAG: type IX secretion system sortase PorU [Candidatus Marinimicrobia bacterium]|nr:type IX secretion system sortase PorU [Candidatus Neomarinimicrobiota bacterium]